MINIPEEVKQLLKNDNTKKNFRVHFPNGERADITNENIIEESVSFTESICSYDKLKFGLCESPFLEFETVGIPNIKGCTIECSIELHCYETTEGAEYKEDIGSWVYEISLGVFVVNSCKKRADMTHRMVQAYSQININEKEILDKISYNISTQYLKIDVDAFIALLVDDETFLKDYSKGQIDFRTTRTAENSILENDDIQEAFYIQESEEFVCENILITLFKRESSTSSERVPLNSKYIFYRPYCKTQTAELSVSKMWEVSNGSVKLLNIDNLFLNYITKRFSKAGNFSIGIKNRTYEQATCSDYPITNFRINKNVNRILGYSKGLHYSFNNFLKNLYVSSDFFLRRNVFGVPDDTYTYLGNYMFAVSDKGVAKQVYTKSLQTLYESIKDLAGYEKAKAELEKLGVLDDMPIPTEAQFSSHYEIPNTDGVPEGYFKITYTPSHQILNFDDISGNIQDILIGWLETQGKFGSIERDGTFSLFDAKDNFITHNGILTSEDYSSLWYDDDESLPIGRLICTWKDAEGTEHFSERQIVEEYDELKFRTYSITDNWFIQNYPYTTAQISAIFDEMSEHITSDIRYMPIEIEMKGRPDIEVGDVFDIETDEGIITGFIEKRTLTGIDNLLDSISAEDEERAISNSSIKSSFDEETGTLTIYT